MTFNLYQHQKDGLNFALQNQYPGTLFWHEMGLGKTITCLMYLRQHLANLRASGVKAPRILILLPKSILHQWKTETLKFAPDIYHSVTYMPYSQIGKAKHLTMYYDFRAVVMDESHYLKNPETTRMEVFCEFLKAIGDSPGKFHMGKYIQLSGTPMLNHAGELYTSWALLTSSHPKDAAEKLLDKSRYMKWNASFTKKKMNSWYGKNGKNYGHVPEGVQHEDMFTELIGPVVHYRRAADCLDLPQKQDIHINLGLPDDKMLADADIQKPEAYMAILERIARAKTPHAIEWVKDFYAGSQEQLVVFAPYKFPLYDILAKNKKRAVIVTGDQNDEERREAIERFQKGDVRIFLTSYRAGGEGINLQCAHHTLYLGYPWSPRIVDQARARTHRNGQNKRTLHHFLMSGENDSNILGLIEGKEQAISAVEDGLLVREQYYQNQQSAGLRFV